MSDDTTKGKRQPYSKRWRVGVVLEGEDAAAKIPAYKTGQLCYVSVSEKITTRFDNSVWRWCRVFIPDASLSRWMRDAEVKRRVAAFQFAEDQDRCERLWSTGFGYLLT